ncbi:MAG: DNA primase [Elusimicrobiota bacterium]
MTFTQETIEQIRLATDIVELVREYVPSLKKAGRNWKANCPFHKEKTPSFMVSADKGIFHCFGCNAGGDAFKFVMLTDNLTWPEAVSKLGKRCGIEIKETREDVVKKSDKQKIYDLLEQAADYYNRCLTDLPESSNVKKYIRERGITEKTVEKFKIGYAQPKRLQAAAAKKGFSPEQLLAAGLITKTDRGTYFEYMSDRLVFPVFDTQGRVVAFGGRTLKNDEPKYLNTPETLVYSKSFHLYGLFQALPEIRETKEIIVLEGYMDVVVTHQEGSLNTVATLGTAFTQQHAGIINRYADKVFLMFDSDAAGNQAARRAAEILADSELSVKVANLPESQDPDEFILKHGKKEFLSFLGTNSRSMIDFITDQIYASNPSDEPHAKAKKVAEMVPVINSIKNAVIRHEWVKICSEKFKTSEASIDAELKRFGRRDKLRPAQDAGGPKAGAVTFVRTAEEEILQIVLSYPQYAQLINDGIFRDDKLKNIFKFISKGLRADDIATHLDEKDTGWFTELVMEEKNYSHPEQILLNLVKDIMQKDLESQRKELEKEVVMMMSGQIPSDDGKIRLYHDLNRQLKGSVKI